MIVLDWSFVRRDFPALNNLIYLNTASMGLVPKKALDSAERWLFERSMGNIYWMNWYKESVEAKKLFAALIGADLKEIALVQNTTMGINIVANSIHFRSGERIILNDLEFPANVFPWQVLAQKNSLEIRVIRNRGGFISIDDYREAVDEKTKIIAVSWVEFSNGFVHNLEALAELAHENNAYLVVDGIQGVGSLKIDVRKIGVDFLVCGGHKWLMGIPGAGFMYVRRELLDELELSFGGWLGDKNPFEFSYRGYKPAEDARRFELGSPNFIGYTGLRESLRYILSIGIEKTERRNIYLAEKIVEEMGKFAEIDSPLVDGKPMSPILSIKVKDAEELAKKLYEKEKIVVAPRMGKLRISPHFYNNEEDVESLIDAIKKYVG